MQMTPRGAISPLNLTAHGFDRYRAGMPARALGKTVAVTPGCLDDS
jgi:hypothetical protein